MQRHFLARPGTGSAMCLVNQQKMMTMIRESCVFLHSSETFDTFLTVEQRPHSSWLCSRCLQNEVVVLWTLLLLSWKNTAKLKPVSKQTSFWWMKRTPSLPIVLFWRSNCKNMMASQRNISSWSIWYILFMDYNRAHKLIKLMTRSMDGRLIRNKLGRRRVKSVAESAGNTAMLG